MSRRSQAFADGNPKFSWKIERLAAEGSEPRYKCSCKTHPDIYAFGHDEQTAMRAASRLMETALETATLAGAAPGATLAPRERE